MIEALRKLRQHLLTGVSFAIPFIACGGILIAAALAFAPMTPGKGPDMEHASALCRFILDIGSASFALMLPVLAGYIAYSLAGKPGLVPGFIGGYLCGNPTHAGFLGAIVIGLVAGWIVNQLKRIPAPRYIKPIMPILVIPIVSSLIVGAIMLELVGVPIANLMTSLSDWLQAMGSGNKTLLALILGAMIAFDMGGPVNKAAFFFGAGMIKEGQFTVMGACAAAICTPPLGMGLATLFRRNTWSAEEREAGLAALAMGMIGITEGAIPFAASDPFRVIPSIMAGSMTAAVIAMLGGVGDHAPHGGPIVLPVVDHRLLYVIAILAGTVVTAVVAHALKGIRRPITPAATAQVTA
jgi:fructose-specific phosphotransferase system IIC component